MKNIIEAKSPKEVAKISDPVEVERLVPETVQSIISEISEITVLQPAKTPPPLGSEVKGKKKAR